MTDLRRAAKGRECKVRLPGVCNFNSETTVLAHLRMAGITGAGQKAPDLLGAHACSACHAEIDRQTRVLEQDFVRLAFLEGVMRTQQELIGERLVKW
jgi:hypothetical protein